MGIWTFEYRSRREEEKNRGKDGEKEEREKFEGRQIARVIADLEKTAGVTTKGRGEHKFAITELFSPPFGHLGLQRRQVASRLIEQ